MPDITDVVSKAVFPLGGDVTQAINPWNWWLNSMGQIGFININQMDTKDAGLERRILERAGSYGKQLGRVEEVLEVLLARLSRDELSDEEREAVADFEAMRDDIAAARHGHAALTSQGVDAFMNDLRALKAHDPDAYERISERIQRELTAETAY